MGRDGDGDQTEYGHRPAKSYDPQILQRRIGTENHRNDFVNHSKAKGNTENLTYPLSPSVLIPGDRRIMVEEKENGIENDLIDGIDEKTGELPVQALLHHQGGDSYLQGMGRNPEVVPKKRMGIHIARRSPIYSFADYDSLCTPGNGSSTYGLQTIVPHPGPPSASAMVGVKVANVNKITSKRVALFIVNLPFFEVRGVIMCSR